MRALLLLACSACLGGCYLSHTRSPERRADAGPRDARALDARAVDARAVDARVIDLPDAEPTCATGPFDLARQELRFAASRPECPWGVDDNLAPAQALATARIEQYVMLADYSGARLCALELDFGPSGTGFRYDDNFFLLFGDVVLAASDRTLVDRLPLEGGMRIWNWSAIAGVPMAVADNQPYCLGEEDGRSRCDIPQTDVSGIARLEFAPSLVAELVERADTATMGFITVGDNDPSSDCAHDAFAFGFIGRYLVP